MFSLRPSTLLGSTRTLLMLLLALITPGQHLTASAPSSANLQGSYGYQGMGGMGAGFMEMALQAQMIQALGIKQSVSSEDAERIKLYEPFLAFLNHPATLPNTREQILKGALEKTNSKASLLGFCENACASASEKNLLPPHVQQELASSLLKQAETATQTTTFGSFLGNALYMGVALGTVECMKKIMGESCARLGNKIPAIFTFLHRISGKGYNTLCQRPDPLSPEELVIWENTFRGVVDALCEQTTAGNLMLKNIRVSDTDDQQNTSDDNWLFFANMVNEVCSHVTGYLNERLPYYAGGDNQQQFLVSMAHSVSVENRTSIAFMIKVITKNLQHMVHICQKAQTAEDLDVVHVKKLGRITLLMFGKLHTMIAGELAHGATPAYAGNLNER